MPVGMYKYTSVGDDLIYSRGVGLTEWAVLKPSFTAAMLSMMPTKEVGYQRNVQSLSLHFFQVKNRAMNFSQ